MKFVSTLPLKKRTYAELVNSSRDSCCKLRIAPIPSWMKLSTVVQYCEKFGKINYGQLYPEQPFGYGVVQFESEDDADEALNKRYHRIENYIVYVELADGQPITKAARTMTANILDLDDKCLLKIFSDFDKFEWCDVANTCKRFQKIAKKTFSSKFDSGNHVSEGEINDNVKKLFGTFGGLMTNIRIGFSANKTQEEVFKLIAENCGDKLRYLRIVNLKWTSSLRLDNDTKTKLKALFGNLQFLDFHGFAMDFKIAEEMLAWCSNMETLHIFAASDDTLNKLNIGFPKLKEVRFVRCNTLTDEGFERFLTINQGIKNLQLMLCENLTSKLFEIIVRQVANLEAISFYCAERNLGPEIDRLAALSSLKSLALYDPGSLMLINTIWNTELPIENLELTDEMMNIIPGNVFDEVLPKLHRVKKLAFKKCSMTDKHLELFAKGLPNLTELRFAFQFPTVEILKKILIHARNLTFLEIGNSFEDIHNLLMFAAEHFEGRNLTIQHAIGYAIDLADLVERLNLNN